MSNVDDIDAKSEKKSLFSAFGSGKGIWLTAAAFGALAFGGGAYLLNDATAQTTYYVLSKDVAARQQITPDLLTAVTTDQGTQPGNAYDASTLQSKAVFAKVAMQRGDVVSSSTAGPLTRVTATVPDDFVVASLTVDADDAAAGKVRPGDLIDVIAQRDDESGLATDRIAKVVLTRVYVLDVAPTLDIMQAEAAGQEVGANAETGQTATRQVPSIYTLAVSPEDAVKVAQIRDKNPYIVMSSAENLGKLKTSLGLADVFDDNAVAPSSTVDPTATAETTGGETATSGE